MSDEQYTGPAIELRGVGTRFGDKVVHENLDLTVRRGEILAIVGGSGSGKSTLLREMIMLHRADAGSVHVLGQDVSTLNAAGRNALRERCGVMFQHGGLFASLTVRENVAFPLREHTRLDDAMIERIADWKISLAGLEPEAGLKYPPQLSGGMVKRASMARAIALDPELLFLDEPTAGLDPVSAAGFDDLVRSLRDLYDLTIVMITHDLDLMWQVTDRVAVLGDRRVVGVGTMDELSREKHPAIRAYFKGPRSRAAQEQAWTAK